MQFRARCGEFLVRSRENQDEINVIDNAIETLEGVLSVKNELAEMFERMGGSVQLICLISSLEEMVNETLPLLEAEKEDIQQTNRWFLQKCEERRNDGRHPGPSA
jgi:hypothetical protein